MEIKRRRVIKDFFAVFFEIENCPGETILNICQIK